MLCVCGRFLWICMHGDNLLACIVQTFIFSFIHQNGSRNKQNINLTILTKLLRTSPQFITMIIQCTDHHHTYSSLQ